jgi:hypothetical protein
MCDYGAPSPPIRATGITLLFNDKSSITRISMWLTLALGSEGRIDTSGERALAGGDAKDEDLAVLLLHDPLLAPSSAFRAAKPRLRVACKAMNDPAQYAAAARAHAERANKKVRQDGPAVLATLALTEALLAVASAIVHLGDKLGAPAPSPVPDAGSPVPAPAPERAYDLAGIRNQYPNAYSPWTPEADAALLEAHEAGHELATLADTFGRQPSAIRSRINRLTVQAGDSGPAGTASSQRPGTGDRP